MATFGERIKQLRIEKRLTQEELAKKFFLNKSSISRYERDQQVPELESLEKLADFFNVTIDYLLGRTDNKSETIKPEETFFHSDNVEYKAIKEVVKALKQRLIEEGIIKEGEPISEQTLNIITTFGKEAGVEILKSRKKQDN